MSEPYSRPERAAEFSICRRHLAKVLADPCAHCVHREVIFGKAVCPTFGRTFPLCTKTPGLSFEIDHETLKPEPE